MAGVEEEGLVVEGGLVEEGEDLAEEGEEGPS